MDNVKCCGNCGSCSNCGNKVACLCPVSLGLALGISCALAVFFWSAWLMYYGMPEMMAGMPINHMMVPESWMAVIKCSLFCLVKGFVFGFVVALIYDMVVCCGKKFCCRKDKPVIK